jgi:F-type H+-transporting ATPase subunit a
MFSPLEQFELFPILVFNNVFFFYVVLITIYDIICILCLFFFLYFFFNFIFSFFFLKRTMFEIVSGFFSFISNLINNILGRKGKSVFILASSFMLLILLLNILGLVPFGHCFTAQLFVNEFFAIMAIIGITMVGLLNVGVRFFHLFIPSNVPAILLPFLSFIEVISYVSRLISLSVRLFANMVAGHALLHILIGSLLTIFEKVYSIISFLFILIPSILIFAVMLLEFGIAFLQAYVFVVLFLIYISDIFSLYR